MNLVQWGEYLVDRTDETPSTAGGIYRCAWHRVACASHAGDSRRSARAVLVRGVKPEDLADLPPLAAVRCRVWRSFLELLLKDWAIRTLDPDEANLFYVPAFTFSYTDNGGAELAARTCIVACSSDLSDPTATEDW